MPRRRKRTASADAVSDRLDPDRGVETIATAADPVCPLCARPIPPHVRQSWHHLIPKLRGGKGGPTVLLHQICHNEIHATLTESELARAYSTMAALRAHPRLAKFAAWVGKRPPEFHSKTPGRRRKRRD